MPKAPQQLDQLTSLIQIVADLRGPDGCPWDKEQDHKSLTRYAIEECYEFVDAVNDENYEEMKDELGDVLLQVVLHSQIAQENDNFSISDVIESISTKMVRRHPHVFSDVEAKDTDQVWKNWEEIKKQEKAGKPVKEGFDIPKHLNALIKSLKMGEKAKKKNFDWKDTGGVFEKLQEEISETKQAIKGGNKKEVFHEVGDLLFTVCQLARHLEVDPEQSLQMASKRFEQRFFKMNYNLHQQNKKLENLSAERMEVEWKKACKELEL